MDEGVLEAAQAVALVRVEGVSSDWDRVSDLIYTSVSVRSLDVFKGWIPAPQLVLRQLGGTSAATVLRIDGAPDFRPGDELLVFLTQRTDGSVYAIAALPAPLEERAELRAAILARTGGAALVDPARLAPVVTSRAHVRASGPCPGALRQMRREVTAFGDACGELGTGHSMVAGEWSTADGHVLGAFTLSSAPVADAPTGLRVTVVGRAITVRWDPVAGALGYRVDFRQAIGGPVLATQPAMTNMLSVVAPGDVSGTFTAEVVSIMPTGPSAPTPRVPFTVGQGGTCTEPPDPPMGGEGFVQECGIGCATAFASWDPLDEPTNWFHVRAYDLVRGGQIFNQAVGATHAVSAVVGPGFMARVEVFEVNVCGESSPLVIIVQ